MGFKITSVVCLRKNRDNPFDMVAVTSEKSEAGLHIFEVDRLRGFKVSVESKRKPASPLHCDRWQQFGHVQFCCTSKGVCAFCAGEHPSRGSENKRGRGQAARYVSCKGDHPSFFESCSKNPEQIERQAAEDRARRVQELEQGFLFFQ